MSKIKDSIKTGFGFGLTSGIITTIGLIVGLNAGTSSKLAVIGGIIIIAIADAFSDALGIHIAEESKDGKKIKHIWESTIMTFLAKFFFAIIFIIPVLLLPLAMAVIASVIIGFILLGGFSFYLGKTQKVNPWNVVFEHLVIAVLVVLVTHYLGLWVKAFFA